MILALGKFVVNPTARFLVPIMNTFTATFLQHFHLVKQHLLGFAVGDIKYDKAKRQVHSYLLFTAFSINGYYDEKKKRFVNIKGGRALFKKFLEYLKTTRYYYDDYIYDDNIHVVVISLPSEYNLSYDKFLQGVYSKMYKDSQIKLMFNDKENLAVLKKEASYREVFKEKLKKRFSVEYGSYKSTVPDDIIVVDEKSELELPPTKDTDWL
jgi:hypothetical protein